MQVQAHAQVLDFVVRYSTQTWQVMRADEDQVRILRIFLKSRGFAVPAFTRGTRP